MEIATGKVVGGNVVLERIPWAEGTSITVVATELRVDRLKYMSLHQVATGTVTSGQVSVPDGALMEGAFVAALESDVYTNTLSAEQRMILGVSVSEGAVSAEDLLDRLKRFG